MSIDDQLWRAKVGIYNSKPLYHFTSLKTNPVNLEICFLLKFSNFYVITVGLMLLACFSVYLFWHRYVIMVSILTSSILLMPCLLNVLIFAAMPLIWNVFESGDIKTNPGPSRSSFIKFWHWNLKKNFTLIHEIWLLLINYNFI